jgi:hypothetical protein
MKEAESLNEVVIFYWQNIKKKDNPPDILRKIWERKRKTDCLF